MINFIIYDETHSKKEYEMSILNIIGAREEEFKIYNLSNCQNKYIENSIYIISTNELKKALRIATEIRNKENWKSPIIIISNLKNINSELLINKLLIFDYIDINDNSLNRLKQDLYESYKMLTKHKTLNFYQNNEIVKIPYKDILYIEKNNNQNYSTIITKSKTYVIKNTINNLEKLLDTTIFMKTHRSCIINIHNIEHYNCTENIVYFCNNKRTDLVCRDKKQILKTKLIEEKKA